VFNKPNGCSASGALAPGPDHQQQKYVLTTDAPYVLTPLYSQHALLHVAALKGQSAVIADTFCEQGLQNTCLDVNIMLKSSMLCVTWQFLCFDDFSCQNLTAICF
jgi:hypothetical protein